LYIYCCPALLHTAHETATARARGFFLHEQQQQQLLLLLTVSLQLSLMRESGSFK